MNMRPRGEGSIKLQIKRGTGSVKGCFEQMRRKKKHRNAMSREGRSDP